ncbi:MAG: hypothetical protein EOO73_16660 [Myxococcales bacterium]|nr:MAG: hypothetical protein EOO73_16660 [Myxococcales bacterium]
MRALACGALASTLLAAGSARGCPCSDDSGSFSGLVQQDERYAAALVATSRQALGRFDALSHYSALGPKERETSEELLLRAGFRGPARFEGVGELGYSSYRFHAPRLAEQQSGLGDALLRARYRAFDEAMPHERFPMPAISFTALLRAPLGAIAKDRVGSFGSGGAQRGLGAWEVGAGFELMRAVAPRLQISLSGEGAYRFEDHVLGSSRKLGPRFDATLGSRALATDWLAASVALRLRMTGDVALAGRSLDGTSERLVSLIVGASAAHERSRFRSALTVILDPPVAGLSRGSTAAISLGVSLGIGIR